MTVRNFRATCIVTYPSAHGPMFAGVIHTPITLKDGRGITAEVLGRIEQMIKANPGGTRIPAEADVTLAGLIELEA